MALLASVALLLAVLAPALAAPAKGSAARAPLADHVTDCNAAASLDAGGDLVVTVDGTTDLTVAQLATLDATALAALRLAAEANVDACINVAIGTANLITVNADIEHCASLDVVINGDGSADVGGVTIAAELLDVRLLAALELVAEADAEAGADACVVVTVTDSVTTVDVETVVLVTLCGTLRIDANGDAFINGTAFDADQFVDTSTGNDFTADVEVGLEIEATLEADDNVFVVVTSVDRPGCGNVGGGGGTTGEVTIMVMKHNCADVMTEAEFLAVEARAATNPLTPTAAFGKTVETVLECPTVVLTGETQTPGAAAGAASNFAFDVTGDDDATVGIGDSTYEMAAACETQVMYDANRNNLLDANVCLDLSHHAFEVAGGSVTVTETTAPTGFAFGALRFTPGSGDEATLVSATNGVITLDTSNDEDGMVMLHVYNFALAVASVAPSASAAPSISDTTVSSSPGTGNSAPALALAFMGILGLGGLGYLTMARRRR